VIADDATVTLVAAGDLDVEDHEVLVRLSRVVAEADPVPDGLVDLVGTILAGGELLIETETGQPLSGSDQPTSMRSGGGSIDRTFTFTGAVVRVTLWVQDGSPAGQVRGVIEPAGRWSVEGRQGAAVCRTTCDDSGRFSCPGLVHGPARFIVIGAGEFGGPVFMPVVEV